MPASLNCMSDIWYNAIGEKIENKANLTEAGQDGNSQQPV